MEYKRYEGETEDELIYRICSQKEQIGTWKEVRDILNNLLNYSYNESTYRKKYQYFNKLLYANSSKFSDSEAQLETLREEKRELEKLKKQIQTEKIEYNKWLREEARDKLITEKIVNAINNQEKFDIPSPIIIDTISKREGLLCFGDEHVGTEFIVKGLFGETINEYNLDVFYRRMSDLLTQTVKIIKKENIDILNIFSLGDFTDGVLRVSQLKNLKYGVVESTVLYANYISEWLNELSKYVKIIFQTVQGNHSQLRLLDQVKGTFEHENMEMIVSNTIKYRLKDNPNFKYIDTMNGMMINKICGFNFVGIHGEVKSMEQALKDYQLMYDIKIDYLIAGHLHHSKSETIGIDKEVINVPSIIGVDPYSIKLRKTSNAGATLLIISEEYGKEIEYSIKLR